MTLEKAIKSGKEYRKPYYGSKAFDPSCRNHTCFACESNKKHKINKKLITIQEQENVYTDEM